MQNIVSQGPFSWNRHQKRIYEKYFGGDCEKSDPLQPKLRVTKKFIFTKMFMNNI